MGSLAAGLLLYLSEQVAVIDSLPSPFKGLRQLVGKNHEGNVGQRHDHALDGCRSRPIEYDAAVAVRCSTQLEQQLASISKELLERLVAVS